MSTTTADRPFELVIHNSADSNAKRYELRVLLCPEQQGFSVFSLNLPGIMSQGDSESEAIVNITEAFQGAIAEYEQSGNVIPWGEATVDDAPRGSRELWIVVNV